LGKGCFVKQVKRQADKNGWQNYPRYSRRHSKVCQVSVEDFVLQDEIIFDHVCCISVTVWIAK
jgi:hypothetical protein